MILYFSGTGNSAFAAKKIGEITGDDTVNLFDKIRNNDYSEVNSEKPWIIVSPTYAWRIPRILENWLDKTELSGNRDIYFIMTCGGDNGNAGKYLKNLAVQKKMNYKGCISIVMPENYIAVFETPSLEEAESIIKKAEPQIVKAGEMIKEGSDFPAPHITLGNRITSGFVNKVFYPTVVHSKKFKVTDECISCGKCVELCPLNNISLVSGKPVWKDSCTHCMACISYCPKSAIEYGEKTKGRYRYTFPKKY